MPEYIADTYVYIQAAKDEQFRRRFESFIRAHGPILVSLVTVAQSLICVADASKHTLILDALRAGSEIIAPTPANWSTAGTAILGLGGRAVTEGRSFWNDALFAAQCARLGATLITTNPDDFKRLRRHTRGRAVAPFPN